ncbi:hypothetical protein V5N11_002513 [Cardamine amara subsp. amara]|uniref:GRF-type domain-containing protein n=1 Tax=Cardamine amara subsp. amara TaxID=228776 RepID=A0ABD1B605_CARAN
MPSTGSFMSGPLHPTTHAICDCGDAVVKLISWTDSNRGWGFFKCAAVVCEEPTKGYNYFLWEDIEPPHGWQNIVLLDARDKIRELKVQVDQLKRDLARLEKQKIGQLKAGVFDSNIPNGMLFLFSVFAISISLIALAVTFVKKA